MKGCERVRLAGPGPLRPEELAAHLERCPTCRDQVAIDELLRCHLGSLGGGAVPPGLEARTLSRLRRARPALDRRQRILLAAYWVPALALSIALSVSVEPAPAGGMAITILLVTSATALLGVTPLAYHALARDRWGP